MDQLRDYADSRLIQGCIYCDAGYQETRDHVPSKAFLDSPFPDNLPVVPSCHACNHGFALDEEYLACLIECCLAGSTNPEDILRPRVAEKLLRSQTLRSRLEAAKSIVGGQVVFTVKEDRVRRILQKLATGHAAFELSQPLRQPPTSLMWWPLSLMTDEQKEAFDSVGIAPIWGEVGSRGMQRQVVAQVELRSIETGDPLILTLPFNDWVDVQEGRYRYLTSVDANGVSVKFIIAEFLACEAYWVDCC